MNINSKEISINGVKYFIEQEGREIARAYLYILNNDLHVRPFGFMEDVNVEDEFQGIGIGTGLVNRIIEEAKKRDCYKLICTSRDENTDVHRLYETIGFRNYGVEFRMNLE